MKVQTITDVGSARGVIPAGYIIEIPESVFAQLRGRVIPLPATDWRPEPRAWLENGELRIRGVFDDLAGEIIKLTSDNMPTQRKLLQLHVGIYFPGPHFRATVRKWTARAAHLYEIEGLGLNEARWQAAEEMRLLAWAEEWNLGQPETGRVHK